MATVFAAGHVFNQLAELNPHQQTGESEKPLIIPNGFFLMFHVSDFKIIYLLSSHRSHSTNQSVVRVDYLLYIT